MFTSEFIRASFTADGTLKRDPALRATTIIVLLLLISQILFTSLRPPTLSHPLRGQYVHPTYPLRILSSVQSVTGVVVVGEVIYPSNTEVSSLRYLRVGHSLIGGVWIGEVKTHNGQPLAVDENGIELGDSIYSAFVLQEAVRLFGSVQQTRALVM